MVLVLDPTGTYFEEAEASEVPLELRRQNTDPRAVPTCTIAGQSPSPEFSGDQVVELGLPTIFQEPTEEGLGKSTGAAGRDRCVGGVCSSDGGGCVA